MASNNGTWVWLAVDQPSISADLLSPTDPDRVLIQIRGGLLDHHTEVVEATLPALAGDDSYATLTSDSENGITNCVEGPVAD